MEMEKIVEVGILADGDLIIKAIGEELIRENHNNINFYFLNELVPTETDYVILNYSNKEKLEIENSIFLCEDINENGIFLFQAKAKIKTEILSIIGEEKITSNFKVISGISPYDLLSGTIFNHFIASELGKEGFKVCFISLNISFPFNYLDCELGNKGLVKALYYYQNGEDFNPGIISQHGSDKYSYIETDLKINELESISIDFLEKLLSFLKIQNYNYVVMDLGIFNWKFPNISNHIFYLQNKENSILEEMEEEYLGYLKKFNNGRSLEIIQLGNLENIVFIKKDKISYKNNMEEIGYWKRSLKKILLQY